MLGGHLAIDNTLPGEAVVKLSADNCRASGSTTSRTLATGEIQRPLGLTAAVTLEAFGGEQWCDVAVKVDGGGCGYAQWGRRQQTEDRDGQGEWSSSHRC